MSSPVTMLLHTSVASTLPSATTLLWLVAAPCVDGGVVVLAASPAAEVSNDALAALSGLLPGGVAVSALFAPTGVAVPPSASTLPVAVVRCDTASPPVFSTADGIVGIWTPAAVGGRAPSSTLAPAGFLPFRCRLSWMETVVASGAAAADQLQRDGAALLASMSLLFPNGAIVAAGSGSGGGDGEADGDADAVDALTLATPSTAAAGGGGGSGGGGGGGGGGGKRKDTGKGKKKGGKSGGAGPCLGSTCVCSVVVCV